MVKKCTFVTKLNSGNSNHLSLSNLTQNHEDEKDNQSLRISDYAKKNNSIIGNRQFNNLTFLARNSKIPHSIPVIQSWGPSTHEELTSKGIESMVSGYRGPKLNPKLLSFLKSSSWRMDLKIPELLFNLGGKMIEWNAPNKHKSLVKYYRMFPNQAKNHGEGGFYEKAKSSVLYVNEDHQGIYEIKARKIYNQNEKIIKHGSLPDAFTVSESVLDTMGDALHIAQDRGCHGEGGIGYGHDNPNKNCEDRTENASGYAEALLNTEDTLMRSADFLLPLLVTKQRR